MPHFYSPSKLEGVLRSSGGVCIKAVSTQPSALFAGINFNTREFLGKGERGLWMAISYN